MDVQEINKALIRFTKAGKMHAEEKVNVVYQPLAEKMLEATADSAKPFPTGSITDKIVNGSQNLQDIFVKLTKAERSEIVRECKFVFENYDDIQDYVAENGWASIGYIRKQLTKKVKAAEEPTEEPTEEPPEDTTPDGQRDDYASSIYALLIKAEQAGHDPSQVIQDVVALFKNK